MLRPSMDKITFEEAEMINRMILLSNALQTDKKIPPQIRQLHKMERERFYMLPDYFAQPETWKFSTSSFPRDHAKIPVQNRGDLMRFVAFVREWTLHEGIPDEQKLKYATLFLEWSGEAIGAIETMSEKEKRHTEDWRSGKRSFKGSTRIEYEGDRVYFIDEDGTRKLFIKDRTKASAGAVVAKEVMRQRLRAQATYEIIRLQKEGIASDVDPDIIYDLLEELIEKQLEAEGWNF